MSRRMRLLVTRRRKADSLIEDGNDKWRTFVVRNEMKSILDHAKGANGTACSRSRLSRFQNRILCFLLAFVGIF